MCKKLVVVLLAAVAVLATGCTKRCTHEWENATCEEPVTCKLCGETAGVSIGHRWKEADCIHPKTCEVCLLMDGDPLGHTWKDATCTEPKTCAVCGETEGEPAGHKWKNATYDTPKTCTVCGKSEGKVLTRPAQTQSQTYIQQTPTRKACLICGSTVTRSDTQYCEQHDCGKNGCPYPAKQVPGSYGSFCDSHSCSNSKCTSERYSGSKYCSAHK